MKGKCFTLGLGLAALVAPTAALAEDIYYFNDGNGNCGYVSCGAYGCTVIDRFNCPLEVNPDGQILSARGETGRVRLV